MSEVHSHELHRTNIFLINKQSMHTQVKKGRPGRLQCNVLTDAILFVEDVYRSRPWQRNMVSEE